MRKEELIKALWKIVKAENTPPPARAESVGAGSASTSMHPKGLLHTTQNGHGRPPLTPRGTNQAKRLPVTNGVCGESNGHAKPASANGNGKAVGSNGNGKVPHANGNGKAPHANGNGKVAAHPPPRVPRDEERLNQIRSKLSLSKDLANDGTNGKAYARDRLIALVRGPYWLHAYWELTSQSVERARVALAQHWHAAKPVLRLCEVTLDGTTNTARNVVRDIEIHGGVNNWYVDVVDPPKSYQLDIGYVTPEGRFLSLARSNVVSTPPVAAADALDDGWDDVAKDHDRIYALSGGYGPEGINRELKDLFEERLHRTMGAPLSARLGVCGLAGLARDFPFQVDAELIVYGVTEPGAHVTVRGEPVRLGPDGTFSVRFSLPDRRHVLPVVASSPDGVEQRTIVLAVERNTKVMEPAPREHEG